MHLLFSKDPIYICRMTTPDMTPILEDLAAGRIDAAEAARRIEALKATQGTSQSSSEPTNEELAGSTADSDPWAAVTDQPDAQSQIEYDKTGDQRRGANTGGNQAGQHRRCGTHLGSRDWSQGSHRRRNLGGHTGS